MTGDILSIAVEPDGWRAIVTAEGLLGAAGSFNFGWTTDNANETDAKVILYVDSPGYDGTDEVTRSRVIYGSARIRLPYPDDDDPDIVETGGNTEIKIGLTDYIGVDDVITAIDIKAAFYTGTLASVTASASNDSSATYQKSVVNWTWPGNRRVTTAAIDLSVAGGHWSAENGKPVEAIEFIVTDEHSHTATLVVTEWSIDSTKTGGLPFAEARGTVDLTGFTDGDLLTCRFKAYPHIGNSDAIYDSNSDAPSGATPNTFPSNQTNRYKSGNYGGVAVYGAAGATPTVHPSGTDPTTIPSTDYYGSGNAAAAAIRTYNLANYSHDDAGGGIIYCRTAANAILGSSTNLGAMTVWLEYQVYPGDTWTITAAGSSGSGTADKVKIVGAVVTLSGATTAFSSLEELWFDQCNMNTSGTGPYQNCKVIHVTQSTIGAWSFGFIAFSSQHQHHGIFRQNSGSTLAGKIRCQTLVGNRLTYTGTQSLETDASTWGSPDPDCTVWYNNWITWTSSLSAPVLVANNKPITIGMWVAQNLFEVTFTNASVTICATSTLATNNVMWWNNFIRGARNQFFYNESGNSLRSFCFALNSIFDVCGESTDNSAGTANGANVNDWSVRWRVGHSGCVNKMDDDFPTHGNPEFVGRRSFRPPNGDSSLAGFDKVTDDQGYANGGGTSGGGNYRLLSNSPLHSNNYKHRWVLPFDLEMNGRGQWDPPGPYSAGTTRKGCMFFAA